MKGELWYYSDMQEQTADRPHPYTIRLGLLSPLLAVVATVISITGVYTNQRSMKVGQRAYISVHELSSRAEPNSLTLGCKVTNMGNTPANEVWIGYAIENMPPNNYPAEFEFQSYKFEAYHISPKEDARDEVVIVRNEGLKVPVERGFILRQTVHYDDVFQDHHVLKACWWVSETATITSCGTVETTSTYKRISQLVLMLKAWYYRLTHR